MDAYASAGGGISVNSGGRGQHDESAYVCRCRIPESMVFLLCVQHRREMPK